MTTHGEESLCDIRAAAMGHTPSTSKESTEQSIGKKRKPSKDVQSTLFSAGGSQHSKFTREVLNRQTASSILKARFEAIIARYEPLDAMTCPFNSAALIAATPLIGRYIPNNVTTAYKQYCKPIDKESLDQLVHLMKSQPGLLSIAFDGVTVNRRSKVLFTVCRGVVSMFFTWIDLGSEVHVTQAETDAAYKVCVDIKNLFDNKVGVSCIPVDNAAKCIAD